MKVVLVHGMGRTPLSMRRLARELRRAGHTVGQFGYAAALEPLQEIAARLRRELESQSHPGEPMVVVGHSLGALLLRLAMAIEPPMAHPPRHMVMLGPPNQSPRLARRLRKFWLYRLFNGDAGQRLADPAYLAALPMPTVPYTILAGVNGRRGRWSAFGDEPNDGLVALSETRCGADDLVIEVPARHTFLMNHRLVRRTIGTILHGLEPS